MLALSAPSFILVQGVFYGLGYGLLALGLVLVYRTNRVLNFAQGQIGVIAAVFLVKLTGDFKFNYWFALALSIGLAASAGALSELILRRLFNRPRVLVMVATIGLSYVLLALTALPFIRPSNLYKPVPVPFDLSFSLGPIIITPTEVLTLIVAPLVTAALVLAVRYTSWGLSMPRHVGERRLGPLVGRVDPAHLDPHVDRGRRAVRLHRHPQRAEPDQCPDPGPLARPAALRADRGAGRRHGEPDRGLRRRRGDGRVPRGAGLERALAGQAAAGRLHRRDGRPAGAGRRAAQGARAGERSTWQHGAVTTVREGLDTLRRRVSSAGVWATVVVAALLPLVLSVGNDVLMSTICIYAVVALSLTMLTGWAGQVSLGQFGLVAVGALVAVHLGTSVPLPLVMLYGGAVTALVAVVVGLPALRMPGLFLAVTTLAFAIFMQNAVLATPCFTLPGLDKTLCTGLPNPAYTVVARPSLFGISLASQRSFAWFALAVLLVSIFMVRVWRDRGVARRLVAVRDNEIGAAAMGIPVLRTKLLAFGLSGFMAGYAGVCFAFAAQQLNNTDITFDPTTSFVIISMVVIGGLGSISGAILGALYLEGLPAIFNSNQTIQFITSGLGLILFILYLPGGLAELLQRAGDLVADAIRSVRGRMASGRTGPPVAPDMALVADGAER